MPNYVGNEPLLGVNSRDRFVGDNSTTTFVLTRLPAGADGVVVVVSGVVQDSGTYSVVGKSLVFQDAPPAAVPDQNSQNIEVIYLSRQGAPYTANWSIPIADNTGTGDALLASFNPALTALTDNLVVKIVLGSTQTNLTSTPTINVNGTGVRSIVEDDGSPVSIGSLRGTLELRYEASTLSWRRISKRNSLASGSITTFTSSSSISVAYVNGTIIGNSSVPFTLTLPLAGAVVAGDTLEFLNINSGPVTVQKGGGDVLQPSNVTVSTISLKKGDALILRSDGATKWYVVGGTAQFKYAEVFASQNASPGYQLLPSGIIIQWGIITSGGSADGSVLFPISFPTACASVVISSQANGLRVATAVGTTTTLTYSRRTLSGSTIVNDTNAANWIAIGH